MLMLCKTRSLAIGYKGSITSCLAPCFMVKGTSRDHSPTHTQHCGWEQLSLLQQSPKCPLLLPTLQGLVEGMGCSALTLNIKLWMEALDDWMRGFLETRSQHLIPRVPTHLFTFFLHISRAFWFLFEPSLHPGRSISCFSLTNPGPSATSQHLSSQLTFFSSLPGWSGTG